MPKKGATKQSQAPAPAAAVVRAAPTAPKSWKDDLTEEELKREKEKEAEREAKAKAAQELTLRQNERNEAWRKEEEKKARAKQMEDKKWERELKAVKERAKKEFICEAIEYEDGTLWCAAEKDSKGKDLWKEVKDQYYCSICDKHLNDGTLASHLDSKDHIKRFGNHTWYVQQPAVGPVAKAPVCPPAPPAPAAKAAWPVQQIPREEWQELAADGYSIKCIPCGKHMDDAHLGTEEHKRRLEHWYSQRELISSGYPAPPQMHLAWVLDESNQERYKKCLLCNKWVNDDESHIGTWNDPRGSKDHLKNLRNTTPSDPWVKENVLQVRQKWHPERTAPAQSKAPAGPPKAATPAPWGKQPAPQPPPPKGPPPNAAPQQPKAAPPSAWGTGAKLAPVATEEECEC
mmetsp:Transcript_34523/g.78833  ORF Transcript_34523/g.78833 Transcript_34523/m.78833 type:complete len:402 (-) Transcript_34523:39-1244(-)